jgi:hypothetical protein
MRLHPTITARRRRLTETFSLFPNRFSTLRDFACQTFVASRYLVVAAERSPPVAIAFLCNVFQCHDGTDFPS